MPKNMMPDGALIVGAVGGVPALIIGAFIVLVRVRRALVARRASGAPLRVAFLHPDLGIGGAERLVVDAAVALKRAGHTVSITTAHHDKTRCFEETRDGTLTVHVAGSSVPRHLRGKMHIVCAIGRALVGAVRILLAEPECDVVFVDAVPAPVPLLRACGVPTLFYCHFPDKLLASGQAAGAAGVAAHAAPPVSARALARALYRLPFDLLEEFGTGCASLVLVNSAYTASVYARSFHLLRAARALLGGPLPTVLHPAIDLVRNRALAWPAAPSAGSSNDLERHKATLRMAKGPTASSTAVASAAGAAGARLTKLTKLEVESRREVESRLTKLVSINRFERKKALELAVHALLELRRRTIPGVGRRPISPGRGGGGGSSGGDSGGGGNGCDVRLVLAGGWDGRLQEQVDYLAELEALVRDAGLADAVEFRRNVSDDERRMLLESCAAVVYTPSFEHFGIVPLEAMAAARPVIAVGLGGPCESVVHGHTGWLCEPTAAAFADAFDEVRQLHASCMLEGRGAAARAHVEANFGLERFGQLLEAHLKALV